MIGPLFAALPRPPDADPDPCAACRHVVAAPDGYLCCGRLGHATPAAERVAAWVMAGLTSSCPERVTVRP